MDSVPGLSEPQRLLLAGWLPRAVVVRDHSWGLVARTVLEVEHDGATYVVKAGGPDDHHMRRELRAHREWLAPWTTLGRAPALLHGDDEALLVVTRYLPGHLVEGVREAEEPDVFRQAGTLLALLHGQLAVPDADYEARENRKMVAWLDRERRIERAVEERLRAEIETWPAPATTVVPTHGDWQPRNWLVHDGRVSVIDFGRAALRPAYTDLARLAAQDFARDTQLEAAFLAGYGSDPREPAAWHRQRVREAIGTAVWAYQVGDERFEAQGHRMIVDALAP